MFYDAFTYEGAGYFLVEIAEYVFLNPVGYLANLLSGDGPFITGLLKTGYYLFPVIRDAGFVLLYDIHLEALARLFIRGETLLARQTLAPAPDYSPLIAGAGIDYLITVFLAERTSHGPHHLAFRNFASISFFKVAGTCRPMPHSKNIPAGMSKKIPAILRAHKNVQFIKSRIPAEASCGYPLTIVWRRMFGSGFYNRTSAILL